MDNEKDIVEQFDGDSTGNVLDTQGEICANDTSPSDSTFGKFRDAKSLLDAYNSLQSEFTRKSQRLAEFERNIGTKQEDCSPIYERDDWHEKLANFLDTHKDAKAYSSEIASIILEDKDIAKSNNSLELAWLKVMGKHYINRDNIDSNVVSDYLSTHTDMKEKIIKEYIDSCRTSRPVNLSMGKGEKISPTTSFKTLKDAGEYVKHLLDSN